MIQLDVALLAAALGVVAIAFSGLRQVIKVLYSIEQRISSVEYGRKIEEQKIDYELKDIKDRVSDLERFLEQRSAFEFRDQENRQ